MQPQTYNTFTQAIVDVLKQNPQVIGVVATGSMAATDHHPDQFSDHDFWVITQQGHAEPLRKSHDWLPKHKPVALFYRETEHGVKLVYEDGHLLEYAVFEPDELSVTRVNSYRVLLDRADIAAQLAVIHMETRAEMENTHGDADFLFGEVLTRVLVGVLRYARGERLSGHQLVKGFALEKLLQLAWELMPQTTLKDNIDPFRRVDMVHPELAELIHYYLLQDVPICGDGMVNIAVDLMLHFKKGYPQYSKAAVKAVQDRIRPYVPESARGVASNGSD